MRSRILWAAILPAAAAMAQPETFEYQVSRVRLTRDEPGNLRISKDGIDYHADSSKTSFKIALRDIHEIDVSKPREIRVETYERLARELGGRKGYTFRLREGSIPDGLGRFLAANVNRSVIASYESASTPLYRLGAYHRHRIGGRDGEIAIDQDGIRFIAEKPGESRTWRYEDIETIGSMNSFHFRVATLAETYNFDLKERLPEAAYDLMFQRVSLRKKSARSIETGVLE